MNVNNLLATEQFIQKLDTLQKFYNFIGLLNHFHVSQCEARISPQCVFVSQLLYVWSASQHTQGNAVRNLQQFCGFNFEHFHCARLFI